MTDFWHYSGVIFYRDGSADTVLANDENDEIIMRPATQKEIDRQRFFDSIDHKPVSLHDLDFVLGRN